MPVSEFQRQCTEILAKFVGYAQIAENTRPNWLTNYNGERLELDLFVETLAVAFEIQGEQHYRYIPKFHTSYEAFERQKQHDIEKRILCEAARIRLFIISSVEEMEWAVNSLRVERQSTYFATREFCATLKQGRRRGLPPSAEQKASKLMVRSRRRLKTIERFKARLVDLNPDDREYARLQSKIYEFYAKAEGLKVRAERLIESVK